MEGAWLWILLALFFVFGPWRGRHRWRHGSEPSELGGVDAKALQARLEQLDDLERRLIEVENRLDFTERMLAAKSAGIEA